MAGKTSQYFGVCKIKINHHGRPFECWQAQIRMSDGKYWNIKKDNERDAALAVDIKLIELGRKPVNILVKKTA